MLSVQKRIDTLICSHLGYLVMHIILIAVDTVELHGIEIPNRDSGDFKLNHHGQTLPVLVQEKNSTVALPCMTTYHIETENLADVELFQGQAETGLTLIQRNDSRILVYDQKEGYQYNISNEETPAVGKYFTCRYKNSTEDYVTFKLTSPSDFVNASIIPSTRVFYVNDTNANVSCEVERTTYEKNFTWSFQTSNGEEIPIKPNRSLTVFEHGNFYKSNMTIKFPSSNITDVICRVKKLSSSEWSKSVPITVEVKDHVRTKVYDKHEPTEFYYEPNLKLTCQFNADPDATIDWELNGNKINDIIVNNYLVQPRYNTTITVSHRPDKDRDNYTCIITNKLGSDSKSLYVNEKEKYTPGWVIYISLPLITLLLLTTILVNLIIKLWKMKMLIKEFRDLIFEGMPFSNHEYETVKGSENLVTNIERPTRISCGEFGEIYRAMATDKDNRKVTTCLKSFTPPILCTYKQTVQACRDFMKEIKIMQYVGEHRDIVKFLGVISPSLLQCKVHLLLDHCCPGQLEEFLQSHQDKANAFENDILQGTYRRQLCSNLQSLRTSHLMKWAEQIASAMVYVSGKRIVHRDLAARNILLKLISNHPQMRSINNIEAKLSDFGLSRDLRESAAGAYIMDVQKQRKLPIWWYPIEALCDLGYTSQSDVHSYGCLLWEMFTLAREYPHKSRIGNISDCNILTRKLVEHLENNNKLQRPKFVLDEIWDLMESCWQNDPSQRPTFERIYQNLREINTKYGLHDIPNTPTGAQVQIHGIVQAHGTSQPSYTKFGVWSPG